MQLSHHFAAWLLLPAFAFQWTGRAEYFSALMDLCFEHRGTNLDWHSMDAPGGAGDGGELASSRVLMTVTLPLAEIVTNFFDKLKSRSSGFASFECVPATSHSAFSGHDVLTRLSVFPFLLALSLVHVSVGLAWAVQLRRCGVREERSAQGAFGCLALVSRSVFSVGCAWRLRWSSQMHPLAGGGGAFLADDVPAQP